MSNRVTAAEVTAIIETDIADISPFITAANLIVTEHSSTLDDTTAKEVERWLSAHMVAIRDMRVSSEKAGSVGQNFQHKLEVGLQVTMYGQQALALDSSGGLAKWNRATNEGLSSTPVLEWLGTEIEDL